MPSEKVLEMICEDEKPNIYHVAFTPFISEEDMENTFRYFIAGLGYIIGEKYKWGIDLLQSMDMQKILVAWEALQNGYVHNPTRDQPIHYSLIMGSKGVCHGFQDSGDYFKKEETKKIFESKTKIRKRTGFERGIDCFRIGVNQYIYKYSDLIEVDIEKGILYCVQLKSSLEDK